MEPSLRIPKTKGVEIKNAKEVRIRHNNIDLHVETVSETGKIGQLRFSPEGLEMFEQFPDLLNKIMNKELQMTPLGSGSEAIVSSFTIESENSSRQLVIRQIYSKDAIPAIATHTALRILEENGIEVVKPLMAWTEKNGFDFSIHEFGSPIYPTIFDYLTSLPVNYDSRQLVQSFIVEMKRINKQTQALLMNPFAMIKIGSASYKVDLWEGYLGADNNQRAYKYDNYLIKNLAPLQLIVIDPIRGR